MSGSLNHSPADILRWLLIQLSAGTDPSLSQDWPIYVSSEPNIPDNCVTLYDTTGTHDGRLHRTGQVQEHEGVQIRCRSVDHETGYYQLNSLKTVCDEIIHRNTIVIPNIPPAPTGSTTYLVEAINRTGNIISLGRETTSMRRLFTLNVTTTLSQQS